MALLAKKNEMAMVLTLTKIFSHFTLFGCIILLMTIGQPRGAAATAVKTGGDTPVDPANVQIVHPVTGEVFAINRDPMAHPLQVLRQMEQACKELGLWESTACAALLDQVGPLECGRWGHATAGRGGPAPRAFEAALSFQLDLGAGRREERSATVHLLDGPAARAAAAAAACGGGEGEGGGGGGGVCAGRLVQALEDARRYLLMELYQDLELFLVCRKEVQMHLLEGGTSNFPTKTSILWNVGSRPELNQACEIGFNAGHSTLNWLVANPEARVYAFDLFEHRYSSLAVDFISKRFPGRLVAIAGDSFSSVTGFATAFPGVKCNIMFIDGGHTLEATASDIDNFFMMANASSHVLIVDDTHQGSGSGEAWNASISAGKVQEFDRAGEPWARCMKVPFEVVSMNQTAGLFSVHLSIPPYWEPNRPFTCEDPETDNWEVYSELAVGGYNFQNA